MREHLWRFNCDTIMRKAATSFINYSTMTLCIPSFPSPSPLFHFSFHFSRDQNRKLIPFDGLFLLRTKRKRLMLRRLDSVACVSSFDEGASVDTSGSCTGFSSEFSVPCAICTSTTRLRKLWKVKNLIVIWL